MKHTRTFLLVAFLVLTPLRLSAQFGLTAGNDYGLGVTGQAGSQVVKFEAGAGFMPVLFFATVTGGDDIFEFWMPFCAGAKLNIALSDAKDPNRLAVEFGANYNQILRIGFGGGIDYTVSQSPSIILSGGIQIYPDAKKGLLDKVNEGRTYKYSDMTISLAEFHPYFGLSLLFD